MKTYNNNSGSGIAAYEYGEDWIRVKFKHGRVYEYRAERIGADHLAVMKRLADAGSGLNGYINDFSDVKNGYSSVSR